MPKPFPKIVEKSVEKYIEVPYDEVMPLRHCTWREHVALHLYVLLALGASP